MGDSAIGRSPIMVNPNDPPDDQPAVNLSQSSRPSFIIGRVRTCRSISWLEWTLVISTSISITVGLGFSIFRMATSGTESSELVFSILIVANLAFATFYLIHGIFQEQPFEILMLILTTLFLWILIMLNYTSSSTASAEIKLIRFLTSSMLTIPNLTLATLVSYNYVKSGNLIFKTVGADPRFQRMCRELFLGFSLLAFDAQAMVSCIILIMRNGVRDMRPEDILIISVGAVFIGIWLGVGYTAMRTENLNATYLFGACSLIQPVYVVYLIVQGIELLHKPYSLLSACIFVAGGTLTLTHFTLMAMVTVISFNYGRGLKEKVYGGSGVSTRTTSPVAAAPDHPSDRLLSGQGPPDYSSTDDLP